MRRSLFLQLSRIMKLLSLIGCPEFSEWSETLLFSGQESKKLVRKELPSVRTNICTQQKFLAKGGNLSLNLNSDPIALVFTFIIKIRFPKEVSVATISISFSLFSFHYFYSILLQRKAYVYLFLPVIYSQVPIRTLKSRKIISFNNVKTLPLKRRCHSRNIVSLLCLY